MTHYVMAFVLHSYYRQEMNMSERRHFTRILYLTRANLTQGDHQWQSQLVDISLRGALLLKPDDWHGSDNREYGLDFVLSGSDIEIRMRVELVHDTGNKLGFHCPHIDIDSATHLKRMLELNLGDERLLNRELEQLLSESLATPEE